MKVTATLRTRCGCYRQLDTTWPPAPEIVIPLKPRGTLVDPAPVFASSDTLETRVFELRSKVTPWSAGGEWFASAEYEEKAR
jgi:hypothetical protein